jgi:predicted NAD/FAD-binding protein
LALSVKTGHPVAGLDWVDAKTVRVRGRKAADGSDFELTADAVILACHSDQALEILGQVDHPAKDHLRKIRYQPNKAYLHTDLSFMPRRRGAWAAWNYQSSHLKAQPDQRIAVTYWMNQLQSLVFDRPLLVTLNPLTPPPATETLRVLDYAHPIFDGPAIQAQSDLSVAQGADRVWFAGAWLGNGFHEDGFQSGRQAAMDLVERLGRPSHSHGPTAGQLESLAAGSMA